MMEPLTILVLAIITEAILNLVTNIKEKETSWKYWGSLIVGLVVGVAMAVNWDIDLFRMIGLPAGRLPLLGPVLTGLLLSRGSNYMSDLISRIRIPSSK